jgi:hypothetical protein
MRNKACKSIKFKIGAKKILVLCAFKRHVENRRIPGQLVTAQLPC